ncbi:Mandelate racemase / muconate lactonizing enzyme, N-terminal domain [Paenibacillus algorifonticola]|uniref:Mandelate racemase / muconate lactonizing enzyme, N-terminal domain n=1 Tax=Paenibacillus algorifonticola TaxID=684063 RepID=A0A1I2A6J2_9BACL|nr:mandelate racemase/muconate lactonizing enzyme family protein [Paenibacillus algorifonticola]SFE39456.1 Mandelate racemase / muconate lactonizing enzyme, N-terminal domain [Paenibacillus algorifonticola]
MINKETYEETLAHVRTSSNPTQLRITDIRFTDIVGGPFHSSLIKVYTNQGLVGFGEVRDGADKVYAQMLKARLLGENPCHVDKLFRRIKQFGGHARQGGGVSGLEIALWDLAGKAYGVPVYQMLGGRFRDRIRMYCDTEVVGKDTGKAMGEALKKRMDEGFTFLKMDLGIGQIIHEPGTLSAPLGFLEEMREKSRNRYNQNFDGMSDEQLREITNRHYDIYNIAHPFTAIQVTEKGLDLLEQYVADVRSVIGYQVPLAIDHFGHIGLESCIKLGRRVEKFNLAWMEDMLPWQYTEQYAKLARAVATPICTGEDIYLKENFKPLLEAGGVSVIHPDVLTTGGILETKKIGDMAQDYGAAMAIHMAESPIACLAAAHVAAATENFLALEYHSCEVPWWDDIIISSKLPNKLVQDGFITISDAPGLGIDDLNDEVLAEHLHPDIPGIWESTDSWNKLLSNDRLWS